ncbi:MAG: hypothetical protein WC272_09285 [Sulfurimonas sp.]|jgi:hypothetical protein
MKVKYIVLAVLAMFSFSGCDEEYAKVPLSVPVDFSKKDTVYETDFQAPWNIWGSLVRFDLVIRYERDIKYTDEQRSILHAVFKGMKNNIPIPKEENKYFKLKVTLTPLGLASDDMTVWSGASRLPEMTKKEFKDGEKIEFVASIPLYGGDNGTYAKTIMVADLQRLQNYHIRVESLEDVELPKELILEFRIRKHSRKV